MPHLMTTVAVNVCCLHSPLQATGLTPFKFPGSWETEPSLSGQSCWSDGEELQVGEQRGVFHAKQGEIGKTVSVTECTAQWSVDGAQAARDTSSGQAEPTSGTIAPKTGHEDYCNRRQSRTMELGLTKSASRTSLPTAVLQKTLHSNGSKRVPKRPLRSRRGRFGTLLQQLERGIFEKTAVPATVLIGPRWSTVLPCCETFPSNGTIGPRRTPTRFCWRSWIVSQSGHHRAE